MEISDLKKINDDLLCQKFELMALSDIVNYGKLERWTPGFCNPHTESEHQQRYDWVASYCRAKHVLDLACGCGFGSYLLATKGQADQVLGADLNQDAVRYATIKNKSDNLSYQVLNAENYQLDKKFDLIVSFETIEHLRNVSAYLKNIFNHLKEGGLFIVSTPISRFNLDSSPHNPYHVQEWGFVNFQKVIKEHNFQIVEVYLQSGQNYQLTLIHRVIRRFLKTIFKYHGYKKPVPVRIEKFSDNHNSHPQGYQILVCKKNV